MPIVRWGALVLAALGGPAAAQSPGSQRLRVAVMDLSGSALKMQTTQMPGPGMPMPQAYGPPPQGQQTTVTIAIPPPAEFARGLTEMLTSVMVRTGRFVVLERAAMQQLEQEQNMGPKVTRESAVQQGGMLGAQALITGDITGFTFGKSSVGGQLANVIPGLTVATERVSAEVIIDLRLIDATTGEVIYSTKGKGKASQTGVAADLVKAEKSYSAEAQFTTPLGQASRQAIQNAVAAILSGMPAVRWSARVVDVRQGTVYLGASALDGMRPGLELDVFEAGEPLVDPATGKSLGAPEALVGSVVVDRVLEQFSTAKLPEGLTIARGHVIRLKQTKP